MSIFAKERPSVLCDRWRTFSGIDVIKSCFWHQSYKIHRRDVPFFTQINFFKKWCQKKLLNNSFVPLSRLTFLLIFYPREPLVSRYLGKANFQHNWTPPLAWKCLLFSPNVLTERTIVRALWKLYKLTSFYIHIVLTFMLLQPFPWVHVTYNLISYFIFYCVSYITTLTLKLYYKYHVVIKYWNFDTWHKFLCRNLVKALKDIKNMYSKI